MQNKNSAFANARIAIAVAVLALSLFVLLLPSVLSAMVWTKINLYVAISLIILVISFVVFASSFRWIVALLSAFIIAVPVYPNWIRFDNSGLIAFEPAIESASGLGANLFVFLVSIAAFASLFWSIGVLMRLKGGKG